MKFGLNNINNVVFRKLTCVTSVGTTNIVAANTYCTSNNNKMYFFDLL